MHMRVVQADHVFVRIPNDAELKKFMYINDIEQPSEPRGYLAEQLMLTKVTLDNGNVGGPSERRLNSSRRGLHVGDEDESLGQADQHRTPCSDYWLVGAFNRPTAFAYSIVLVR